MLHPLPSQPSLNTVDPYEQESPHGCSVGINLMPRNSGNLPAQREVKVLEARETYDEVDGKFQFTGTAVVFSSHGSLYHVFLTGVRKPSAGLHFTSKFSAEQGSLIPTHAYAPRFPPDKSLSQAPYPLPTSAYIKKPSLINFDRYKHLGMTTAIAEDVLREAEVCEILLRSPHTALAKYYGCEVSEEGHITGLCFAKYKETLMKRVNARGFMKREFKYSSGLLKDRDSFLVKLKEGINHLHSLNLVHNDINPSNIMLDENENPVIIDFGSCIRIGQDLHEVGRTYEWHDEGVQTSKITNDIHALEELGEWLSEKQPKVFRFKE